mmetsp:Transcript_3564/g.6831  ORF Transcript_3564/g.6831 Transcript_3564/m.6831 type:complete len:200 (+) Transcript_3564:604-1203(+)
MTWSGERSSARRPWNESRDWLLHSPNPLTRNLAGRPHSAFMRTATGSAPCTICRSELIKSSRRSIRSGRGRVGRRSRLVPAMAESSLPQRCTSAVHRTPNTATAATTTRSKWWPTSRRASTRRRRRTRPHPQSHPMQTTPTTISRTKASSTVLCGTSPRAGPASRASERGKAPGRSQWERETDGSTNPQHVVDQPPLLP